VAHAVGRLIIQAVALVTDRGGVLFLSARCRAIALIASKVSGFHAKGKPGAYAIIDISDIGGPHIRSPSIDLAAAVDGEIIAPAPIHARVRLVCVTKAYMASKYFASLDLRTQPWQRRELSRSPPLMAHCRSRRLSPPTSTS
jgi:hypothetical protein